MGGRGGDDTSRTLQKSLVRQMLKNIKVLPTLKGSTLYVFTNIFYIIESSQHSGAVRPKMEAIVGATFARPKLPSLMVYLVFLS